jgi:hypothetical protein
VNSGRFVQAFTLYKPRGGAATPLVRLKTEQPAMFKLLVSGAWWIKSKQELGEPPADVEIVYIQD